MPKTIEKIIGEVIHESGFRKKDHIISPRNFKKILESSDLDFIIIDEKDCSVKVAGCEDEYVIMLIHLHGVTLKYSYSPGLGSFPNSRNKIIAYGTEENIQLIKDKLDHTRKELGY